MAFYQIVAALVFAAPLVFGVYLMSRMRFLNTWLEAAAFGMPAGIALFTAFLFLLYAIAGDFSMLIVYMALAVFLLPVIADISLRLWHKGPSLRGARRVEKAMPLLGLNTKLLLTILVLFMVISSIFIFSVSRSGNTIYCIDAGCSDTLYHIGLGNSLIYTGFPPKYPFAIGTTNVYPFMNDMFAMLLNYLGFGLVASIIVPDILMVFSFVTISVLFAYKATKSSGAAIASVAVFWFGGNGLMKLIDVPFATYLSKFMQPIHLIPQELSYMPHATVLQYASSLLQMSAISITYWTTIINDMLIAQHDFMLGLPMGLALLYLLYMFVFEKGKDHKFGARELILIGVLAGLLPLIHPTTLVVLIVVGIFFLAYSMIIKEKRGILLKWLYVVIPLLLLAVPELYFMNMQHRSSNWFFPNYGGFVIHTHVAALTYLYTFANIVFFWIEVASLPIILGFVALLFVKRDVRLLFVPFFVLLATITLYSPLPNPADSNKIFVYIFFVLSLLTGMLLERIYRHKGMVLKIAAIIILLLIVFNFAYVYLSDIVQGMQILVSSAQMSTAEFILYNTPINAVFAENGYNSYFSPIASTLGARVTLISYDVYVGGIFKYTPSTLEAYNKEIFSSGSCSLIRQFNISYIYLQTPNTTAAKVFDNSNFSKVYSTYDNQKNQYIYIYKTYCD
ncbi:MAG: hypothetical protein M1360_02375 [Candidatus Marsarchaeota archaeon]|jgi:hypothetical protein|nr:hypothetical protein [Candidatus Marsarchaeota archaeon]MCL5418764.1 hypothetical protein [Candidatus Marsarchaeota archaeon]